MCFVRARGRLGREEERERRSRSNEPEDGKREERSRDDRLSFLLGAFGKSGDYRRLTVSFLRLVCHARPRPPVPPSKRADNASAFSHHGQQPHALWNTIKQSGRFFRVLCFALPCKRCAWYDLASVLGKDPAIGIRMCSEVGCGNADCRCVSPIHPQLSLEDLIAHIMLIDNQTSSPGHQRGLFDIIQGAYGRSGWLWLRLCCRPLERRGQLGQPGFQQVSKVLATALAVP